MNKALQSAGLASNVSARISSRQLVGVAELGKEPGPECDDRQGSQAAQEGGGHGAEKLRRSRLTRIRPVRWTPR